jgi:NAD(P)-dependent dehydrogenase (short-subunit alcohol dehydrogenase family)
MSSNAKPLQGVVAVVTGASRGAGKGIALALGAEGATVYLTGRSQKEGDAALPGTIYGTAAAINEAGGKGIAVACDHGNDAQVKALFEQVQREQGHVDILVNNATFLHDQLIQKGGFWEKSLDLVNILDVGLRSSYVASWYAAPMMVKQQRGLIIFTSSFGGNCYMHGPAYGAQKAGIDKLARDMAIDLRKHNVAAASIWMGILRTDRLRMAMEMNPAYRDTWAIAETPEFTGHLISAMYRDPKLMEKSGQVVIGAELATEYGVKDSDDRQPISHRPMLGSPQAQHPAVVE